MWWCVRGGGGAGLPSLPIFGLAFELLSFLVLVDIGSQRRVKVLLKFAKLWRAAGQSAELKLRFRLDDARYALRFATRGELRASRVWPQERCAGRARLCKCIKTSLGIDARDGRTCVRRNT